MNPRMHHRGINPFMNFNETYRCYSIGMMPGPEREQVNHGGKIILPPSALAKLTQLNIEYPMLFELTATKPIDKANPQKTHAGVLEFIAEEGRVYVPHWMLKTLLLQEGALLTIKNISLPLGKFVKIQPQSTAFLDISDPKAVLEQSFRHFSCLTRGDIISISYNDQIYEILVMETKPSDTGISVIETDLEVDFAPPLGYVEPDYKKGSSSKPALLPSTSIEEHIIEEKRQSFSSFHGSGNRLSGKEKSTGSYGHTNVKSPLSDSVDTTATASSSITNNQDPQQVGIPNALMLPMGRLYFGYPIKPLKKDSSASEEDKSPAFTGSGQSLRAAKKTSQNP